MNKAQYSSENFPEVSPGVTPTGAQILVQLRTVKAKVGSIILAGETRDFNQGSTQLAKVIKLGQIAFRNRETGELWKEGTWADVGDIVVMPKFGGFRFELPIAGTEDKAIFAVYNDVEVKLVVEESFAAFDTIL